jgi:hypothetical protein
MADAAPFAIRAEAGAEVAMSRILGLAALASTIVGGCRDQARRVDLPTASSVAPTPVPVVGSIPEHARRISRRASFELSRARLTIEDIHMSARFDDVLARTTGALVVNGGFFDPRGNPIGLAVSNNQVLSNFSPSMSGGVLWIQAGVAHLSATEDYRTGPVDFAIQCRPRLVVQSRVNIRSDDGHRAPRTAVCLRNSGQSLEFDVASGNEDAPGPTLQELASELADLGCEEALNLDGGPSTGWAARDDGGLSFDPPRAPVRHAVVVRIR